MVKKLFERGIVSVRYEVDGQTILVATLIIWPYRVFEVTTGSDTLIPERGRKLLKRTAIVVFLTFRYLIPRKGSKRTTIT